MERTGGLVESSSCAVVGVALSSGSCSELCVDEVSGRIFGAGGLRRRVPVSQASRRDFQRSGPVSGKGGR